MIRRNNYAVLRVIFRDLRLALFCDFGVIWVIFDDLLVTQKIATTWQVDVARLIFPVSWLERRASAQWRRKLRKVDPNIHCLIAKVRRICCVNI